MRKWLIAQRQKPKHVRDNIAFVVAGAVTVCLSGAWFFLVPDQDLRGRDESTINNQPFSTFASQLQEQLAGARVAMERTTVQSSTTTPSTTPLSMATSATSTSEEVAIIVVNKSTTTATTTPSLGL